MDKTWLEVKISVPPGGVDLVAYLLSELGSQGVVTGQRQLDTFIPPDPDEPVLGDQLLQAYFPPGITAEEIHSGLAEGLTRLLPLIPNWQPSAVSIQPVQEEDWAEGWKQHFTGFQVGPLQIRPSWETGAPATSELVMELDPGMAFGTGTHATTRLCLEALQRELAVRTSTASVLDVGTGSGILAIAAAKLGAARVTACDIDPEACRIARENAAINKVESRIEITTTPLEEIPGRFEIVIANILAEENIRLADALLAHLADDGLLILSGILEEKQQAVARAFSGREVSGPEVTRHEEWSSPGTAAGTRGPDRTAGWSRWRSNRADQRAEPPFRNGSDRRLPSTAG